jgi:hypothetical protein
MPIIKWMFPLRHDVALDELLSSDISLSVANVDGQ